MTATITHHPLEGKMCNLWGSLVIVELVENDTAWVSFDDGSEEEVQLDQLELAE